MSNYLNAARIVKFDLKRAIRRIDERCTTFASLVRVWLWRGRAQHIGRGVRFYGHVTLLGAEQISIGDWTSLNEGVLISSRGAVSIGNGVRISARAMIISGALDTQVPEGERLHFDEPIYVEDGVWIGAGAIILHGVRIGKDSVVAAGCVVTSNVPPRVMVAGVPARVIKHLEPTTSASEALQNKCPTANSVGQLQSSIVQNETQKK